MAVRKLERLEEPSVWSALGILGLGGRGHGNGQGADDGQGLAGALGSGVMIEVVSGEGPEPETIVFLDRPEWQERTKRAVLLGRPFLMRGKDLDLTFVEELAQGRRLKCQLLAADQALFWVGE